MSDDPKRVEAVARECPASISGLHSFISYFPETRTWRCGCGVMRSDLNGITPPQEQPGGARAAGESKQTQWIKWAVDRLAELEQERDAARAALRAFVTACESAPPIHFMEHISEAFTKAREALGVERGGDMERP